MFDFKYAEFIVPSFVITALVFAGLIASAVLHARRWRKKAEELERK